VRTLHVLTPTYKPVGGVVKIFDYVLHACSLGYDVSVWSQFKVDPAGALFAQPQFRALLDDDAVRFHRKSSWDFGDEDLFFISLPSNYQLAHANLPAHLSPERIIHIIQNVRHVNPAWLKAQGSLVLTRPASRISINQIVADTIEPWLDPRGLHRVVNLGHESSYFGKQRTGGLGSPVRVAYTTWKSEIGTRVEEALAGDGFEFRAIRETASWDELRELYHWADVFLSSPGPEEGMYLPGLEAMAAGCLVVTPDVGGNLAYCRPGENCLLVGYESVPDYVAALQRLAAAPAGEIETLRSGGYAVVPDFDLAAERKGFAAFLDELWERVRLRERG